MQKTFLKWAGGKTKALPYLLPLINDPNTFCEPFAGSLVVSLNVKSKKIIINDINTDLINVYRTLISEGKTFIDACKEYFLLNNEDNFNLQRNSFNNTSDAFERAKLFIYLNRHCFNGLTRYNKSGKFNVPYGRYKTIYFPETEMLNFCNYFKNIDCEINNLDFTDEKLYSSLKENDVVYFDPPYVEISDTANFKTYSKNGFSNEQQIKLVQLAKTLKNKGIKTIISNSDVEFTRNLYSDADFVYNISMNRNISAKSSSRIKVKELIAIYENQN